jgi:RHS repeat-associated protein
VDNSDNVQFTTDGNGTLAEHLEYFPFGEVWIQETGGATDTKYFFASKELDPASGLYYFGARYFEPRESVFASADPIQSDNPYVYAHENPGRFSDPDGRLITVTTSTLVDGRTHVHIELKGIVYEDIRSARRVPAGRDRYTPAELEEVASAVKNQIEFSYQLLNGKKYVLTTKADIRVATDPNQIEADDHVFRIVNSPNGSTDPSEIERSAGRAPSRSATITVLESNSPIPGATWNRSSSSEVRNRHSVIYINQRVVNTHLSGETREGQATVAITGAHEFGHTGGLYHPDVDRPRNLMNRKSGAAGDRIEEDQIRTILFSHRVGLLNHPGQGSEHGGVSD